jgi:hypothetical protein
MPQPCRRTAASLVFLVLLPACATESKIVRHSAPLAGLPGAQTGMPIVRETTADATAQDIKIVLEDEAGHKTLIARAPRHLMSHIITTLNDGDRTLFTDQVLSEHIKRMYNVRGEPADQAFDLLLERRDDIQALFDTMPLAENTPGVLARYLEPGTLRIQTTGMQAEDLRWTAIDMIFERGNWKLIWFSKPGR